MEGRTARWYARQRGSAPQRAVNRADAVRLTVGLADGADILEIAPGPGYLAIEIARLGRFRVTGVDISHTFVEIATEEAGRAGVRVDFRHGDASELPFDDGTFDLLVCQAAFKNFVQPAAALDEMYRVLRPGGAAVIDDLNSDATRADIAREVAGMRLGRLDAAMTRVVLAWLRRRAYTADSFARLAAASAFGTCSVSRDGIGLEVRLTRTG
jgi:ubiquinone/menaquinone biosynthesis C-methylase UbiE